eukprot:scaffold431_cov142-Skeletonema_menzelii.AAC.12
MNLVAALCGVLASALARVQFVCGSMLEDAVIGRRAADAKRAKKSKQLQLVESLNYTPLPGGRISSSNRQQQDEEGDVSCARSNTSELAAVSFHRSPWRPLGDISRGATHIIVDKSVTSFRVGHSWGTVTSFKSSVMI